MKAFVGNIFSGDTTEKTVGIMCPEGVKGITVGQRVLIIPIDNENMTPWGHISKYMKKYNSHTGEFDLELRDTY